MKTAGIIVEYNPFHNGHLLHINKTKEITKCDTLIAVMSGNFTQRGEMAIIDKWQRTQFALLNGVDIVIEIPYIYTTQSADVFANAAIKLLQLANVDSICFGSESNDLNTLIKLSNNNDNNIKDLIDSGMGYPKAYGLCNNNVLSNDILGIAYLKALKDTNITPYSIKRDTLYHDLSINPIASATAIRNAYFTNQEYQIATDLKINEPTVNLKMYYKTIQILLNTLDSTYLANLFLFSEGIENHLKNNALKYDDYHDFLNACTNKRYSKARICRTLIQLLNQVSKQDVANLENLDYIRILGFNNNGQKYLSKLKKSDTKIASKFMQIPINYRNMEFKTTLLYGSFFSKKQKDELIKKELGGAIKL